MNVNALGKTQFNPLAKTQQEAQKQPINYSKINRLDAQINEEKDSLKETLKEAQKAISESPQGSSQKGQLLQNVATMKQQQITMLEMQKKNESAGAFQNKASSTFRNLGLDARA